MKAYEPHKLPPDVQEDIINISRSTTLRDAARIIAEDYGINLSHEALRKIRRDGITAKKANGTGGTGVVNDPGTIEAVKEMTAAGASIAEISKALGISVNRVNAIRQRNGIKTQNRQRQEQQPAKPRQPKSRQPMQPRSPARQPDMVAQVENLVRQGKPTREIVQITGLTAHQVAEIVTPMCISDPATADKIRILLEMGIPEKKLPRLVKFYGRNIYPTTIKKIIARMGKELP